MELEPKIISDNSVFDTYNIRVIFGIINSLILLFTIIGCTFFLYLFYQERKHRKIAHNFVISMCLGDIVHGGLGCGMVIQFCTGLKLADDFCIVATCLLLISVYISLFTLTSTAIDRYLAVCHPVKYQTRMNHKISYGIILLGWILAIIVGIPLLYMKSDKYKEEPGALCLYLSWVFDLHYLFGYLMLIMSICILIVCILYAKIYLTLRTMFHAKLGSTEIRTIFLWIRDQKRDDNSESAVIGFLKVREVKVTCIMFATVVSFVLCWSPCIFVVLYFNKDPNVGTTHILVSYAFPKLYSCINPIFYAYAIKNVRKAFNRNVSKMFYSKQEAKYIEDGKDTNQQTV